MPRPGNRPAGPARPALVTRAEIPELSHTTYTTLAPGGLPCCHSPIHQGKKVIMSSSAVRNVVLVHGGFVDGSGWQGVYESLTRDGFRVAIVQNPTLSLDGDAAAVKRILDAADGPAVLVGHSYG